MHFNSYVGLQQAQDAYQNQLKETTVQETLKKLAWNVDDYRNLYMNGQSIIQKLNVISNAIKSSSLSPSALINDVKELNIPRILSQLRSDLLVFEKNVFKKHRKAASYVLVFMISESTRRHKPYALPIQCIPHSGLQDRMIRQLCDRIKEEMVKVGMIPKGKFT